MEENAFPRILMDNIVNQDRKREESLIDFNEHQDDIHEDEHDVSISNMPSVSIPFSLPSVSVPIHDQEAVPHHRRRHSNRSETRSEPRSAPRSEPSESEQATDEEDSDAESSAPSAAHRHKSRRRHRRRHSKPANVAPPRNLHKDYHERDIKNSINNFTKFKDESSAFHADENSEKLELMSRIQQFQSEGITCLKKVTAFSNLDELRYELYRMSREFERNRSVNWMQQSLVTSIRMMEMANRRFDPFGLKLDGFSRTVAMNLDDYKPSLLGIHSRYGSTRVQSGNPVIQLLFTLAGSLLFHHVSQISKEEEGDRPLTSVGKVISSLAGKNIQKNNPFSKMKGPPSDDDDSD